MNIFLRELKANLKSLLIWCGVMSLLIMIASAKFSAFAGDPSMLAMLESMPKAMVDALSMNAFDLTTVKGFYGLMFIYFALLGAIAAAMWGSDIISKEERDRTVEFSLVLPVSRSRVVSAKALAALVNCILFVLVTWAASIVAVKTYAPPADFYVFLRLEMGIMFVLELLFLSMGLLLGCAMKRYKVSGSTAVGIILGTYFLSIMVGMNKDLDPLKYLTPFKYFDPGVLYRTGEVEGIYLVITAVIIVACVSAAYFIYNKRDLYI